MSEGILIRLYGAKFHKKKRFVLGINRSINDGDKHKKLIKTDF